MKKIYNTSFAYLILGLLMGVFYREVTKVNKFEGVTALKSVHPHLLVLGFIFFLIILLLQSNYGINKVKGFGAWYIVYNIALLFTAFTMVWRGILQVIGNDFNGLSHMAGLGHAVLGGSIIWLMIIIKKAIGTFES
ncbi:DUF2871 domain-containing protein [Clostridium algidicarnis]|uniref:Uncharacterized protein DUF2871 n=2 Tax=Clostridium algidicarnis TaxID=37659 RepID=A0A2S6FW75_9CLOT|nr:DUF2871 domain-containing protein [Clostridium algidicarnis]MBU3207297.1 DUF2871 domain-containing protein [Clostridium algidicarnis]MBU3220486.1 DUF2871 domain-containing protein [Clostridium algidicarnis]PPK47035.1 uncharacterized protein DUF2871 [Clostridium algidicarnis DSM 15099]